MTNSTTYALANAELVDAALAEINAKLSGLSWLNTAYGQAMRFVGKKGERDYRYPAIYTGGMGQKDYLDLLPDGHLATLGGYSFWDVSETVEIDEWDDEQSKTNFEAGLVVWFDFRKVYPADWQGRTVWNVVQDVLDVLKLGGGNAYLSESISFNYSGETIYRGYTHNEIDRQFLMKPFGGFRINCTVHYDKPC